MRPPVCEKEIKYFLGGGGCRFCFLGAIFEIFYILNLCFFLLIPVFIIHAIVSILCIGANWRKKNLFLFFYCYFLPT